MLSRMSGRFPCCSGSRGLFAMSFGCAPKQRPANSEAALEEFEEDKMETLSGPALEAAASEASGIVWKYSSAAEYEGIPIGTWTA